MGSVAAAGGWGEEGFEVGEGHFWCGVCSGFRVDVCGFGQKLSREWVLGVVFCRGCFDMWGARRQLCVCVWMCRLEMEVFRPAMTNFGMSSSARQQSGVE